MPVSVNLAYCKELWSDEVCTRETSTPTQISFHIDDFGATAQNIQTPSVITPPVPVIQDCVASSEWWFTIPALAHGWTDNQSRQEPLWSNGIAGYYNISSTTTCDDWELEQSLSYGNPVCNTGYAWAGGNFNCDPVRCDRLPRGWSSSSGLPTAGLFGGGYIEYNKPNKDIYKYVSYGQWTRKVQQEATCDGTDGTYMTLAPSSSLEVLHTEFNNVAPWKKLSQLQVLSNPVDLSGEFEIKITLDSLPVIGNGGSVQYLLYKSNGSQDLKLFVANESFTWYQDKICFQKEWSTNWSSQCISPTRNITLSRDSNNKIKLNGQNTWLTLSWNYGWNLTFWNNVGFLPLGQNMDIIIK